MLTKKRIIILIISSILFLFIILISTIIITITIPYQKKVNSLLKEWLVYQNEVFKFEIEHPEQFASALEFPIYTGDIIVKEWELNYTDKRLRIDFSPDVKNMPNPGNIINLWIHEYHKNNSISFNQVRDEYCKNMQDTNIFIEGYQFCTKQENINQNLSGYKQEIYLKTTYKEGGLFGKYKKKKRLFIVERELYNKKIYYIIEELWSGNGIYDRMLKSFKFID